MSVEAVFAEPLTSVVLSKGTRIDEIQIQIEKNRINEFKLGDWIKIEGPAAADPQELRTIIGVAPTGIITLDIPLESKHKKGASLRQAKIDPGKKRNIKVAAHLLDCTQPEMESNANGRPQIRIQGDRIKDFFFGDLIKIAGPSAADPQEYVTITGRAPTGGVFVDEALVCKREKGATVKLLLNKKDNLSEEARINVVKDELHYTLRKRLETKDGTFGLRFFSGETHLDFEGMLALTVDIAQLLKRFPPINVKIIGYSGAPSADGVFKTDEDVKYLALKRCQVIRQLLQEKGLMNQILIEWSFSSSISACCLIEVIEKEKEQDIEELNAAAEKFITEREQLASNMRFEVNAEGQAGIGYLARIDVDRCATKALNFKQGMRASRIETNIQDGLSLARENSQEDAHGKTAQVRDYLAVLSNIEERLDLDQPYLPNEEIEYYSKTNNSWLNGAVTKVVFDEHSQEALWFYDLVFSRSGNVKTMVDMTSLRKPLGQNGVKTKVEVYSKRDEGHWLPGYIEGYQPAALVVGYKVMLTMESSADEQLLENVPGERIRRRFEAGTEVEFYVDDRFGWKRAKVSAEAKNGCCAKLGDGVKEIEWLRMEEHESRQTKAVIQTPLHFYPDGLLTKPKQIQSTPSLVEPWTMVPIEIDQKVASEIGQERNLRVELWRLRSPSVSRSAKAAPVFKGLVLTL